MSEVLAHLLALGCCAAMLGLGLGVWLGVRTRLWSAVLAGVGSVVVAVLWWQRVFLPMIQGGMP
jgi:hypothetical protein